jgi:hypothetical protein
VSQWFRIDSEMINDRIAMTMPAAEFKAAFIAAAAGKGGPLANFVKPDHGRPPASIWARLRAATFARDDYTCRYCGERGGRLECDHVVPVSRGGESEHPNLVTACFDCNRSKRNKTPEEWKRVA